MKNGTYSKNIVEIKLKYKSGDVEKKVIKSSSDAATTMRNFFNEDTLELCEEFVVLYLNRANKTIGWFRVSQGCISGTITDNRLILVTGLKCGASSMIVAHNHPSGNREPSAADLKITK
jgi:DNA repair protein RadC